MYIITQTNYTTINSKGGSDCDLCGNSIDDNREVSGHDIARLGRVSVGMLGIDAILKPLSLYRQINIATMNRNNGAIHRACRPDWLHMHVISSVRLYNGTEGDNAKGGNIEGVNAKGGNAKGGNAEGEGTERVNAEGEGTEGEGTEGVNAEGEGTEGEGTERVNVEGEGTEDDKNDGEGVSAEGDDGEGVSVEGCCGIYVLGQDHNVTL